LRIIWFGPSKKGHDPMTRDKSDPASDGSLQPVSVFRRQANADQKSGATDLATGREIFQAPLLPMFSSPAKVWESLTPVTVTVGAGYENRLFIETSNEPAVTAFDMLRTRLLHGLAEKNWRRIAVTSPTHGCGKSFVATNLALALARRPTSRTILLDLDLRRPELASILGQTQDYVLKDFLTGDQPLESVFRRYDKTLALGLNTQKIQNASEILHNPETLRALDAMTEQLSPEVVLYDLPPALVNDDLIALSPAIDAVLFVADGTQTSPQQVRAFEKLLDGRIPLLGVVLNRAQDAASGRYSYAKN
jgi:protein-tyrosine kinase